MTTISKIHGINACEQHEKLFVTFIFLINNERKLQIKNINYFYSENWKQIAPAMEARRMNNRLNNTAFLYESSQNIVFANSFFINNIQY